MLPSSIIFIGNHGQIMGRSWADHGQIMGRPWAIDSCRKILKISAFSDTFFRSRRRQLVTLHAPTCAAPAPPHKHYGLLTLTLHNWKEDLAPRDRGMGALCCAVQLCFSPAPKKFASLEEIHWLPCAPLALKNSLGHRFFYASILHPPGFKQGKLTF